MCHQWLLALTTSFFWCCHNQPHCASQSQESGSVPLAPQNLITGFVAPEMPFGDKQHSLPRGLSTIPRNSSLNTYMGHRNPQLTGACTQLRQWAVNGSYLNHS